MSDFYFGTDLFSELDRLQRHVSSAFGGGFPSSIRSSRAGAFPALNIGTTEDAIEIVAFAPGIDPSKLELSIDKGLLTIAGERPARPAEEGSRAYAQERFKGTFRRVVELPQQADPDNVRARYVDGLLVITVGKREASKPRAITVQ
ncbi:Hsp20/alpha crystallin family protein [Paraburkholderia phymatum]|uniref:Heat shock protein Hsp20 n=1 Tax=Paraburkholderia phymatum (strain DSM 17167 / CIP 108236 / LMG 21445 / STM815) TaxID=391038 RepID=B2JR94_PARP8|nr:Hsp20/alpha crystallin family protein [Paraburkholderia phymatum]ACC73760.1 heat shock protein Hsp20 [Paraburkholderia phymatum STM815]